jgi:uncharacterized membrane protein YkoI
MKKARRNSSIIAAVAFAAIAPMTAYMVFGATTVTEDAARATALARVPGGIVQSAELEHEHGHHVWSFDIKDPKSAKVVEILVDADSGRIVSQKIETPAEQAREAAADLKVKRP